MDLDQILCAPVAKRRRLADDQDEVQVPQPSYVQQDPNYPPRIEQAPPPVTQWPCQSAMGDVRGMTAINITPPSINVNNLVSAQYVPAYHFSNEQAMPTHWSRGMGDCSTDFYNAPNPNPNFHVADTAGQHSDSAYHTSSWSQPNVYQPPQPAPYTSCLESDTSHPSNFQNNLSVHHDPGMVCLPGPKAPQHLDNSRCSEYTQLSDVERFDSKAPEKEVVCFGMVPSIPAKCHQLKAPSIPQQFLAEISSSESGPPKFAGTGESIGIKGHISSAYAQMMHGILGETSLRLEVLCVVDLSRVSKALDQMTSRKCHLDITLFGPVELFDEIGSYFEGYEVYLQDPLQNGMQDFRYCNPHRLSSQEISSCPFLSDFLVHSSQPAGFEAISHKPDLLDLLSSHDELDEHPQPRAIRTNLKRHQKQALTFMRLREEGWALDSSRKDIWTMAEDHLGLIFINKVTGTHQRNEPQAFRGGIIADPMGLGKTLTMISLIAADQDLVSSAGRGIQHAKSDDHPAGATLIIVPPTLLGSWEEQIREHTGGDVMRFRTHHGKYKITDFREVENFSIVLTTYQTVSADWKEGHQRSKSVLYSKRWNRVILDEAHFIRNERNRMSLAVCHLEARARWAVTGTPVQNRLDDLASLLKFIRAYPYNETQQFKTQISALWKSGEDEDAIQRLKYLSSCLLLRRPKATISLPPRHDLLCPVEFRKEEKDFYNKIREAAITSISDALQSVPDPSFHGGFFNVLQQIESMRLVCNLGLHYHSRHATTTKDEAQYATSWHSNAQQSFNYQQEMGSIICMECSSNLGQGEALLNDSMDARKPSRFFGCSKFCCAECYSHLCESGQKIKCGHIPCCPDAPVSLDGNTLEELSQFEIQDPQAGLSMPSKVEALVTDIRNLPRHQKCVVFSAWRLTLELVEAGLERASIPSVRFDGKVPQKDRQKVVERFRKDPTVRVMLLTLSCGSVGLTLSVASRAYLMEPHWNPTLEEQALARIHRLGQTREVTTIRFYIRNSIEEQVIELQASKKQLAGVVLGPHDAEKAGDNLGSLHHLRSLL